jgi:hypothetical protein
VCCLLLLLLLQLAPRYCLALVQLWGLAKRNPPTAQLNCTYQAVRAVCDSSTSAEVVTTLQRMAGAL